MSGLSTRRAGVQRAARASGNATANADGALDVDNFFDRDSDSDHQHHAHPFLSHTGNDRPNPRFSNQSLTNPIIFDTMADDSKMQIMRQVQQEAAMQNARMLVEVLFFLQIPLHNI